MSTREPYSTLEVGDKVICIKKPPGGCFQCKVGAKATVDRIRGATLWTKEELCPDYSNGEGACYDPHCFALQRKKISFKTLRSH